MPIILRNDKMSTKNLPLLLIILTLTGCINLDDINLDFKFPVSLYPLYTDKEIIFVRGLLGNWEMEDSDEIVRFDKFGEKAYEISLIEDGKIAVAFESHLLKLDNRSYLDISPAPPDVNSDNPQNPLLLSTHMFAKIKVAEPNLQVQFFFVPEAVEKDPNFLKHEMVDSFIVLTVSTKDLQDFIKAHADDKELFGDPSVFKRVKPGKIPDSNDIVRNKP
jgi:hypothetical protein